MEDQFEYWEIEDYTRISAYDGRGDRDLGRFLKVDILMQCLLVRLDVLLHTLRLSNTSWKLQMLLVL
jgi:hypothetical protein